MIKVPNFSQTKPKLYEIPAPGRGGLNLEDLEYSQTSNQSPSMLNMMYKNGAFGKRHGQTYISNDFESDILALAHYKNEIIVHAGTKLYSFTNGQAKQIFSGLTAKAGVFINFNKNLYYLNGKFVEYDGASCKAVEPYVPDVVINRTPDGTYSDIIQNYNRLN
jgi:hypothetical protein